MNKTICFDMDGTIANLYAVNNWLEKLRAEDASPYKDAEPIYSMTALNAVLQDLKNVGYEIRVITWLAKDSSNEYKRAVRQAKLEWLEENGFIYDHFHGIQYGRTKADCVRGKADEAILIDDNKKVCAGWHLGRTIDPTNGRLIEELRELLRA